MTSPFPSSSSESTAVVAPGPYLNCIDALLRVPEIRNHQMEMDALLELRRQLLDPAVSAEELVHAFCQSRQRAESTFYLPFYRLRSLLEQDFEIVVSDRLGRLPDKRFPLRTSWKHVEPMKQACVQACFEHSEDPVRFEDLSALIVRRERAI